MKHLITIILFIILATAAHAGEPAGGKLTLDECISIALRENSSIKLSAYSVTGAEKNKDEAFTQFLPKLTGKASYMRLDEVPTTNIPGFGNIPMGSKETIDMSVELTQPLFTGGRIKSGYDISKSTYDSAKKENELTKKDVAREVTENYFQVLKVKKLGEISKSSRDLLSSHLADVEAFFEAGMVSKNDVLSVKVSLSNAENMLIKATNGYELAKSSLNFTLNRDVNADVTLQDIDEMITPLDVTLKESTSRALSNREELKIINNAKSINKSLINIEKSAHYPQFYFIGSYKETGDKMPLDSNYYSALVTMELDIFSWGEKSSRIESQKIELKKTHENEVILKNSIRMEVKSAYLRLTQAADEIKATKQAVEQADENYRIYDEKFKVNAATSTDVLDAENLILTSKINYFQALYNYHIAKVNLKRATGEITY